VFDWLKAKDKLEKSMVADNKSGKSVQSEVRTSSGMFLEKKQVSIRHYGRFHFLSIVIFWVRMVRRWKGVSCRIFACVRTNGR
jgi:hypothetical protein